VIRRIVAALVASLALGLLLALPVGAAETPSPSTTDTPATATTTFSGAQDQVSFGTNIHIGPGQVVRDVFCFGCSVVSEGTVARDLVVFGGNADILGPVGRDVFDFGGRLHLGPKATVGRDLNSVGGSLVRDPGATVGRDQTSVGGPDAGGFPNTPNFGGASSVGSLIPAAFLILLAMLAVAMFPRQLAVTAALLEARPGASFGLGCVGVLAAIAIAVLLAITVILIPISFLLALGILLAWIFGWAAIYLVAGRRLLAAADRPFQPLLAVIVGGALFAVLTLVPLVSIPIGLIGGSIALGAALGSRFGTRSEQSDFFAWGNRPAYPTTYPASTPPPPQDPPEGNT
jgi:hypothetical protein